MDQLEELREWTLHHADGLTSEEILSLPTAVDTLANYTAEDLTLAGTWWEYLHKIELAAEAEAVPTVEPVLEPKLLDADGVEIIEESKVEEPVLFDAS